MPLIRIIETATAADAALGYRVVSMDFGKANIKAVSIANGTSTSFVGWIGLAKHPWEAGVPNMALTTRTSIFTLATQITWKGELKLPGPTRYAITGNFEDVLEGDLLFLLIWWEP